MASPLTLNQSPNWVSLSSKIGRMVPSLVGPTLIKILPPQLTVIITYLEQDAYFFIPSISRSYLWQEFTHGHHITKAQISSDAPGFLVNSQGIFPLVLNQMTWLPPIRPRIETSVFLSHTSSPPVIGHHQIFGWTAKVSLVISINVQH